MTEDALPEVVVTTNEAAVADQVIAILSANAPNLYQRAGALCRVVRGKVEVKFVTIPDGGASIQEMPVASIREEITRHIRLVKRTFTTGEDGKKKAGKKSVHASGWLPSGIASRGVWTGVRPLVGLTEAPFIRPDGSIFQGPGYDHDTGVLCEYDGKFPAVPAVPTPAQVQKAVAMLLDVVADFPFKEPHDRAAWVSALLTIIARQAFKGCAPFFTIDATVQGTGKTLLADAISYICFGREFARSGFSPTNDEENEKRITCALLTGHPAFLIDNIIGSFGGEAYDRLLTGTTFKGRILGASRDALLPALSVWIGTGNNLTFRGDITRRLLPTCLQSSEEFPDRRSDFKHPNLKNWIADNRRELYVAALTVLRAFYVAGCPQAPGATPIGSFEDWCRVVRSCVIWAGLPDPALGRAHIAESGNENRSFVSEMIVVLLMLDPEHRGVTAAQLVSIAEKGAAQRKDSMQDQKTLTPEMRVHDLLASLPSRSGRPLPDARSLGMKINHAKGINVSGTWITRTDYRGTALWKAEPVAGAPSASVVAVSVLPVSKQVGLFGEGALEVGEDPDGLSDADRWEAER